MRHKNKSTKFKSSKNKFSVLASLLAICGLGASELAFANSAVNAKNDSRVANKIQASAAQKASARSDHKNEIRLSLIEGLDKLLHEPEFSELAALIQQSHYFLAPEKDQSLTVFLPTDKAIKKLPPQMLAELKKNPKMLEQILKSQMISEIVLPVKRPIGVDRMKSFKNQNGNSLEVMFATESAMSRDIDVNRQPALFVFEAPIERSPFMMSAISSDQGQGADGRTGANNNSALGEGKANENGIEKAKEKSAGDAKDSKERKMILVYKVDQIL